MKKKDTILFIILFMVFLFGVVLPLLPSDWIDLLPKWMYWLLCIFGMVVIILSVTIMPVNKSKRKNKGP